ncbi:MAG TPA: hypothetical protein VM120_23970 [Bryobacteraceae bacterium]|nr:hypothetical protein [Bryobacteraceae bacterium]
MFSTYLGGNGSDGSSAVAVDSIGSVYLAGQSASTDFIVAGNFLAKLDGDGQNLSFPLNSFGWWIRSIATDGSGNIYLTGAARSDLPLVRAYWTTPPGNNSDDDAFITKLSSSGSILYSTYFAGFRATGEAIAADAAGAAYIAGSTSSAAGIEEIPVTNAFQPQSDGADAFVAKILDSPDTRLVSVTVTAGPPNTGLSVSVDGQTTSVPRTFRWLAGSTHTISTTRLQGGSPLRFTFLNWSDGGALSHSITVPSTDITYTASFQPEIQLVTDVFPNGRGSISVSPASSDAFYPLNTNLTFTAAAAPGFFFTGWAGAISGTTNPRTLQLAYNFQQPITTVIANFGTAPPIGGVSLGFVPVTPCRLVDTRPGEGRNGNFGPPLIAGGTTRDIPVTQGVCNIPAAARAYSLNVTVVPARPLSFLTIYPTGQQRPDVSTLNAFEGQIVANAAIVPAGTNGSISIFATDDTHVIVDINGYFTDTSDSLSFYTLAPCRLIDTRTGSGGPGGEFGPPSFPANTSRTFNIPASNCNVPANARAYVTNFTVVPKGRLSYIATWPTGAERPLVSTLNSLQGRVLANAAIVPAGTNGAINIFSSNDTDIVVDISGYFAPPGGVNALRFYALNPCRLVDTRQSQILGAQQTRTFSMRGDCGAPVTAAAFSLNTTVAPPDYLGFLTLFPSSGSRPFVSTLNAWEGQVAANAAIVPGTQGTINAYATNLTHLILDINGYFAP